MHKELCIRRDMPLRSVVIMTSNTSDGMFPNTPVTTSRNVSAAPSETRRRRRSVSSGPCVCVRMATKSGLSCSELCEGC